MDRKIFLILLMVLFVAGAAQAYGPSLAGYWKFDNNANDSSTEGDAHHGTWVNGSGAYAAGIRGTYAASFNGSSYINCGGGVETLDGEFDTTGSLTVAAWVKIDGWPAAGWTAIVNKGDSPDYDAFRLQQCSVGPPGDTGDPDGAAFVQHGIEGYGTRGATILDDNVWHHVVGVYNADTQLQRVYVDGALDSDPCEGPEYGEFEPAVSSLNLHIGDNPHPDYTGNYVFEGLIDDVRVYKRAMSTQEISQLHDGHYATDYNPDPGQTNVRTSSQLSWEAPLVVDTGPTAYDVYFGKNPVVTSNPKVVNGGGSTSYTPPGGLDPNATYYWRVDTYDGATPYTGIEASFRTGGPPIIIVQPDDQIVDPCTNAVFTVEVDSEAAVTYQWYLNDAPISDANTLAIKVWPGHNEGDVYCNVSNVHGNVDSDTVICYSKKVMGSWPLNGDPCDQSSYLNHGILRGDPCFVADDCKDKTVLELDGINDVVDCNVVSLTNTGSLTVSFWANPNPSEINKGLISKRLDAFDGTLYIETGPLAGQLLFHLSPDGTGAGEFSPFNTGIRCNEDCSTYPVEVFTEGEWSNIVCTFDTDVQKIYANGLLINTSPIRGVGIDGTIAQQLRLGSNGYTFFAGRLSDVKILNYAMDKYEVADAYLADACAGTVCADPPEFDTNGDCVINYEDFANWALAWLECGTYDDCVSELP